MNLAEFEHCSIEVFHKCLFAGFDALKNTNICLFMLAIVQN